MLVVKLHPNGGVAWQRGFNSFGSDGAPAAAEHALSVIQTSERGYLVAGNWDDAIDRGLVPIATALPVQTTIALQAGSPSTTRATSISSAGGQC